MPFPLDAAEREELERVIDRDAAPSRPETRRLGRRRAQPGAAYAASPAPSRPTHVLNAANEYFETYPDKLVIAYWHKAVGVLLEEGLAKYNPVLVDGSVSGR